MNLTNQTTSKKIIMRRLFKQDMNDIIGCYKKYDYLYYNPVNESFICDVLLQGEVWGAFKDDRIIACCYFFPLNSSFFQSSNTYSSLCNFICEPQKYMYMGYIGTNFGHLTLEEKQFFTQELSAPNGLYTAFLNVVHMQTFRQGLKYILHSVPLKLCWGIAPLFAADYMLIKLRGLDNLVVHYIFCKAVHPCDSIDIDNDAPQQSVRIHDTKKVSALLESGYCCVDYITENNDELLIFKKSITD